MDYPYCDRCGRRLRNPKAIKDGMGKTCRRKAREEAAKAEFERNQMKLELAE